MTEIPTWLEELVEEVVGEHSQAEPGWCSQRWQLANFVRGQLEDEAEITRLESLHRGSPVRVVEDDLLDDLVGLLVEKIEGLLADNERLRAIREPVKKCIRSLKSERETLESALREALAELEQEASE